MMLQLDNLARHLGIVPKQQCGLMKRFRFEKRCGGCDLIHIPGPIQPFNDDDTIQPQILAYYISDIRSLPDLLFMLIVMNKIQQCCLLRRYVDIVSVPQKHINWCLRFRPHSPSCVTLRIFAAICMLDFAKSNCTNETKENDECNLNLCFYCSASSSSSSCSSLPL
mmetsp:Transcript_8823/g.21434  ORF Transcript_8823/g.21434 Transcript_8823/m.21434 type:complete len:166 (+) Transcript_8823:250-747(+)